VESQFDPTWVKRAGIVLKKLLGEHGRQFGLLNEVWDYQSTPNRTVDFYVAQSRQNLEANPKTPRHILTAHRSGYRFVPPGIKT